MAEMMMGPGAMMWGVVFLWLLVVVGLILGGAALLKYLFAKNHR